MRRPEWRSEASKSAQSILGRREDVRVYRQANAEIIKRVVAGRSIDSGRPNPAAGVRLVYNIAAVHVRAVLRGGFLNAYDIAATSVSMSVGSGTPTAVSAKRRWVDDGIASIPGSGGSAATLYYGAVELNGAGMRYYGDMCCVISPEKVLPSSLVLFRNSYDLDRIPLKIRIAGVELSRNSEALAMSGTWQSDLADMIICKIMDGSTTAPRLMTSGLISGGVLSDEDYIEIPRQSSFKHCDVEEIRTSASDAAEEAIIADHLATGSTPSLTRLLWRNRRRDAERASRSHALDVRVVTNGGRVR